MANAISMRDFAMNTAPRRALAVHPQYAKAVADFLRTFELVFGDDWEMTLDTLRSDAAEHYIHEHGTFINPGVADEDSNWWNRGSLLASYRRLKAILDSPAFGVVELHPCGHAAKPQPQPAPADDFI